MKCPSQALRKCSNILTLGVLWDWFKAFSSLLAFPHSTHSQIGEHSSQKYIRVYHSSSWKVKYLKQLVELVASQFDELLLDTFASDGFLSRRRGNLWHLLSMGEPSGPSLPFPFVVHNIIFLLIITMSYPVFVIFPPFFFTPWFVNLKKCLKVSKNILNLILQLEEK